MPPNYPEPIKSSIRQVQLQPSTPSAQLKPHSGPIHPSQLPAIREKMIAEFVDVFDETGPLKTMNGPPMRIELKPDAIPYAVNGCRPIPFAQREAVKTMLDDMV